MAKNVRIIQGPTVPLSRLSPLWKFLVANLLDPAAIPLGTDIIIETGLTDGDWITVTGLLKTPSGALVLRHGTPSVRTSARPLIHPPEEFGL